MRKIMSQAEIDKRKKRNVYLIGAVMIIVMLSGTIGYSFMDRQQNNDTVNEVTENGFTFYRYGDYWRTEVEGKVFEFAYLPSEVSDVPVNGTFSLSKYSSQTLYYNLQNEGAAEVLKNLQYFYQRSQQACVYNTTCDGDFPVKACGENLFVFEEGENNVYKTGSCVYIIGDATKGADAFLYKLIGVD